MVYRRGVETTAHGEIKVLIIIRSFIYIFNFAYVRINKIDEKFIFRWK